MHILLTNDDGYYAPGLQTLYETLVTTGGYDVTIVAPEGQQSATGHSITLFDPLFLTEHLDGHRVKGFAVRGTPADCVKIAIQGGITRKIDLVISGINKGLNVGNDVFYSGTVSAAMEGMLLGVNSLAVSAAVENKTDFASAAVWMTEHLPNILNIIDLKKKANLININLPAHTLRPWQGIKVTRLGKTQYQDVFEARTDPHGRKYYWQAGTLIEDTDEETDIFAIQQGYVSLTPLHCNLTDFIQIEEMKKHLLQKQEKNEIQ